MSISSRYKLIKRRIGRVLIGRNPFDLAYFFCKGVGLEVGARNNPYPFGRSNKVFYADIGDEAEVENILEKGFRIGPAISKSNYAKVDYVLTAPKYDFKQISDNYFDFIYSDNVLEHTPNPIFYLIEQLRITKVGGFVYAVIPNKEFTFDKRRMPTTLQILIEKYEQAIFNHSIGEALDVIQNTIDFPKEIMGKDSELEYAEKMLKANDGSFHFHVFDTKNTLDMLNYVCEIAGASLEYFSGPDHKHIHFALCKSR